MIGTSFLQYNAMIFLTSFVWLRKMRRHTKESGKKAQDSKLVRVFPYYKVGTLTLITPAAVQDKQSSIGVA